MLLTALPPAPPTPKTVMRGFSSRMSGIFRLMLMGASCWGGVCRRLSPVRHRRCRSRDWWLDASETLAQPAPDPGYVACCRRAVLPRMPRFEMFKMRGLRIDQEPGQGRKRRALRDVGQAGDAERTSECNGSAEDVGGEIG